MLNSKSIQVWFRILSLFFITILAYTPHIKITLEQLSHNGLTWLASPRTDFLWQHMKYIFHYNEYYFILITIGLVLTAFKFKKTNFFLDRLPLLFLFIIPFIIGYYYSTLKNPILQHSTLFFSFPAGLLFLFSFYEKTSMKYFYLLSFAFIGLNTYSLCLGRNHYRIIKKEPHHILANILTRKNTKIYHDLNPKYVKLSKIFSDHQVKQKQQIQSFFNNLPTLAGFRKTLMNDAKDTIYLCNLPLQYKKIAKEFYNWEESYSKGHTLNITRLFNKKKQDKFTPKKTNKTLESNFLSTSEFDMTNHFLLDSLVESRHQIIEAEIHFHSEHLTDAVIVLELYNEQNKIEWRGFSLDDQCCSKDSIQRASVYLSLYQYFKNRNEWKSHKISIYLWNQNKSPIMIKSFKLNILPGNHLQYGLFEDLS